MALSAELLYAANEAGVPNEDIFVDGIVTPVNIQQPQLMSLMAYQEMVGDDLLRTRLELLDIVEEGFGGATLDDGAVAAWMQSLNNMRLILGERLSLEGVDLESSAGPDEPAGFLFEWIGGLLELLVRAAAPSLPPGEPR